MTSFIYVVSITYIKKSAPMLLSECPVSPRNGSVILTLYLFLGVKKHYNSKHIPTVCSFDIVD